MDVLILRLLLDGSFFLAIFNPLIQGNNLILKYGLSAALAVWMGWLLLNWKKKDLEGRIHDVAVSEIKILCVAQVYELVILGFKRWPDLCGKYVILFAVTAILFLRAGRLVGGSQEKRQFWGANGIELAAILGLAAIGSSKMVKTAAWKLLGGFYMKIIFPILMALLNLFQAILMLLEPLIAAIFSDVEFEGFEVSVDNRTGQDFLNLTGNEELIETPIWAKIAGAVIVVGFLAMLLYFFYKKFAVSGSGRDRKIRGEVKKSTLGPADRSTVKKNSFFEEKNVRYYYRKFLNHCRKHNMWPETEMVTSEMMQNIVIDHQGDESAIEELTTLYRDVRYGGCTEQDTDRVNAKSLVKKIKASFEKNKE